MLTYHTGLRFQQGRGLGSIFGAILRGLKPIAKMGLNAGKRFIKSDFAKNLASTALDMGKSAATNIAVDLLEGRVITEQGLKCRGTLFGETNQLELAIELQL